MKLQLSEKTVRLCVSVVRSSLLRQPQKMNAAGALLPGQAVSLTWAETRTHPACCGWVQGRAQARVTVPARGPDTEEQESHHPLSCTTPGGVGWAPQTRSWVSPLHARPCAVGKPRHHLGLHTITCRKDFGSGSCHNSSSHSCPLALRHPWSCKQQQKARGENIRFNGDHENTIKITTSLQSPSTH